VDVRDRRVAQDLSTDFGELVTGDDLAIALGDEPEAVTTRIRDPLGDADERRLAVGFGAPAPEVVELLGRNASHA